MAQRNLQGLHFVWYRVLNKVQVSDDPPPRKIPLIFSRADAGREPVREWLKGLPEAERHAIGKDH